LKFIIEGAGHKVIGMACDGIEAVQKYKDLKPDIVTLDITMKVETGGLEALKEIMAYDPKAKVIMISAMSTENLNLEASRLGASGCIKKPFNIDEITAQIKKVSDKC
jgi:two-component system chemotaxis response regulator CheY